MASGDDRRERDSRTGYSRPNLQQEAGHSSERYRSQQQQPYMQSITPSQQYGNQSSYTQYGYYSQNAQPQLHQPHAGYEPPVPRSSHPPFSQSGMIYGMAQSSSSQQYGLIAPAAGPLPHTTGMAPTGMLQPSYYAGTEIGQQGGSAGMLPQSGPTDQGQYYQQSSSLHEPYRPCLLYTSPSPRDGLLSRMPSSA